MNFSRKSKELLFGITAVLLFSFFSCTGCALDSSPAQTSALPNSPPALPTLAISLSPSPAIDLQAEAVPIEFSTSPRQAKEGEIEEGKKHVYLFWGKAGQTITINTHASDNALKFALLDKYGSLLANIIGTNSSFATLPTHDNYFIQVLAPDGNGRSRYQYSIQLVSANEPITPDITPSTMPPATVVPTNTLPTITPTPQEITFPPSSAVIHSATISDMVSSDGFKQYVLQALEGQTIVIFPNAGSHDTDVKVEGENGVKIDSIIKGDLITAVLPSTQHYLLTITTQSQAENVNYTMTVGILDHASLTTEPEYLTFEPGKTTTSKRGILANDKSKTYIISGNAGQRMFIDLLPTDTSITLSVRGSDGFLLGWVPAGTPFSSILPLDQEYYIDLVAPRNAAKLDFVITVKIE